MLIIDGNSLTIEDVIKVCKDYEKVKLSPSAEPEMNKSRSFVDKVLNESRTVYGITTGFGELANKFIEPSQGERLQLNIVRSHAAGVGTPFDEDVVRGVILLRANALAKGHSGVRISTVNALLDLLNHRIYPFIPSQGSVGASGDLAPLSHLALVLIGEGECIIDGKRTETPEVLKKAGLSPIKLLAKEGLGLINGTQVMASLGCLAYNRANILLKNAQIAGAMSLEALKGTAKAFDPKVHEMRPHPGQLKCAANIRNLIANSEIISSHANCEKVQDAYTLRCMPQVYGAVLDTITHVGRVLSIEINSATDNPLIFPDSDEAISGGNFHGEPLAFIMDFLGIALSEVANISERTIDRMVNPHKSGLPAFLSRENGINSGFMVAQYTAASLVSENKVLSHPSSVDSIPTSAGQEDHVSMGTTAARHARDITRNVENVIAIEMLAAAQGMDFWDMKPGIGTKIAHDLVRKHVPFMEEDRIIYKDMEIVRELVDTGVVVDAVEKQVIIN